MTVHVLGHILETPALAFADWRRHERARTPAARTRTFTFVATGAIGFGLAIASLGWIGAWHHGSPAGDRISNESLRRSGSNSAGRVPTRCGAVDDLEKVCPTTSSSTRTTEQRSGIATTDNGDPISLRRLLAVDA